jgi:hypothetical protein
VLAEVARQHEAHRLLVAAVAGQQERSATRRLGFQHSQITEEGADNLTRACTYVGQSTYVVGWGVGFALRNALREGASHVRERFPHLST